MDKHLLDRPHPYNFITIHRGSQNIFTQARLNNKQSTIKCRQQTLAEAAWGADVVHDAVREPQSGAPIRKLNFPSAEDAVAALVQEAGCSREEAQCRLDKVKAKMLKLLRKRTAGNSGAQNALQHTKAPGSSRQVHDHISQRGSSTTRKGLFGLVKQDQHGADLQVHDDDVDEDDEEEDSDEQEESNEDEGSAPPAEPPAAQACPKHTSKTAPVVPAKRALDATTTNPAKPGTGSTQCPSRLAAEGAAPACDSKRHKGPDAAHGRGGGTSAPGPGQPYYRDFDDLAADAVAEAARGQAAPSPAQGTAPAQRPALGLKAASNIQEHGRRQLQEQQQVLKQEAEPEQQLGEMAGVHPGQQEPNPVKEEPWQQQEQQQQQGAQQPLPQPIASYSRQQQQSGARHFSGSGALPTESQQTPAAYDPMHQSALNCNPLQPATHEAPPNPAHQGTSQQPAPGSGHPYQRLEGLLDRRMCQGLSNWPPAEVFSTEALPGSTVLQGSVAVTPQLLALLLTPKPLVIKLLKLCKFWARQRHLSLQTCNIRERPALMSNSPTTTPRHKGCSCIRDVHVLTGAFVLVDMGPGQAPRLGRVAETISIGDCLCCSGTCLPTPLHGDAPQVALRLETGTVVPTDKLAEADVSTLAPRHVQYMLCEYAYQLKVEKHVEPITRADVLATLTRLQGAARCLPLLTAALKMRADCLAGGAEVVAWAGMCPSYPPMRFAVQQPADEMWSRVVAALDDLGSDAHAKAVLTGLHPAQQRPQHAASGTSQHPFRTRPSDPSTAQASQHVAAQLRPASSHQVQPRAAPGAVSAPQAAEADRDSLLQGIAPVRVGQKRPAEQVEIREAAGAQEQPRSGNGQDMTSAGQGGAPAIAGGKRRCPGPGTLAPQPPASQHVTPGGAAVAGTPFNGVEAGGVKHLLQAKHLLARTTSGQHRLLGGQLGQGHASHRAAPDTSRQEQGPTGASTPASTKDMTAMECSPHIVPPMTVDTSQQRQDFRAGLKALLVPSQSGPGATLSPSGSGRGPHPPSARRLSASGNQSVAGQQQVQDVHHHLQVHTPAAHHPGSSGARPTPAAAHTPTQVKGTPQAGDSTIPPASASAAAAVAPHQTSQAAPQLQKAPGDAAGVDGRGSMAGGFTAPAAAGEVKGMTQPGNAAGAPGPYLDLLPPRPSRDGRPGVAFHGEAVRENLGKPGVSPIAWLRSITSHPKLSHLSFEELRWEAVQQAQANAAQQQQPRIGGVTGGSRPAPDTPPVPHPPLTAASAITRPALLQEWDAKHAASAFWERVVTHSLRVEDAVQVDRLEQGHLKDVIQEAQALARGEAPPQPSSSPSPPPTTAAQQAQPKLEPLVSNGHAGATTAAPASREAQVAAPQQQHEQQQQQQQQQQQEPPALPQPPPQPLLRSDAAAEPATPVAIPPAAGQPLVSPTAPIKHSSAIPSLSSPQVKAGASEQPQAATARVSAPPLAPKEQATAATEPSSTQNPPTAAAASRPSNLAPHQRQQPSKYQQHPQSQQPHRHPVKGQSVKESTTGAPTAAHTNTNGNASAPAAGQTSGCPGPYPARPALYHTSQPGERFARGVDRFRIPDFRPTTAGRAAAYPDPRWHSADASPRETFSRSSSPPSSPTSPPFEPPSPTYNPVSPGYSPTYMPTEPAYRPPSLWDQAPSSAHQPPDRSPEDPFHASFTASILDCPPAPKSPRYCPPDPPAHGYNPTPIYIPASPVYTPSYTPATPPYTPESPAHTPSSQRPHPPSYRTPSPACHPDPEKVQHSSRLAPGGQPPSPAGQAGARHSAPGPSRFAVPPSPFHASSTASFLDCPPAPKHPATDLSRSRGSNPEPVLVPRGGYGSMCRGEGSDLFRDDTPDTPPARSGGTDSNWGRALAAEAERCQHRGASAAAGPSRLSPARRRPGDPGAAQDADDEQQEEEEEKEDYVGDEGTPDARAQAQAAVDLSFASSQALFTNPALSSHLPKDNRRAIRNALGLTTRDVCVMAAAVFHKDAVEHQLLLRAFLILYLGLSKLGSVEEVSFVEMGNAIVRLGPSLYRQFKEKGGNLGKLFLPWSVKSRFPIFRVSWRGPDGNSVRIAGLGALRDAWLESLSLGRPATAEQQEEPDGEDSQGEGDSKSRPWWAGTHVRLLLLHLLGPYVRGAGDDEMEALTRRAEAKLAAFLLSQPEHSRPMSGLIRQCRIDDQVIGPFKSFGGFVFRSGLFYIVGSVVHLKDPACVWRLLVDRGTIFKAEAVQQ